MNFNELRSAADAYFLRHLNSEEWNALPEEVKQGAVIGAEADIALELNLPELELSDKLQLAAFGEQALHLAQCRLRPAPEPRLASETVDGIGSRTWELPQLPEETQYPQRVRRLIESIRRRNGIRFGRG